jgi:hypothetical protein
MSIPRPDYMDIRDYCKGMRKVIDEQPNAPELWRRFRVVVEELRADRVRRQREARGRLEREVKQ